MATSSAVTYPVTVSQSPIDLSLSTGDTNKTITTSVLPATASFTPVLTSSLLENPFSSCAASLGFSGNGGAGSVNTTVTAGAAGCSGVFKVEASVASSNSGTYTQVPVPPQILIQFLHGEAGGQTGAGDMPQLAIASSAVNRFGDSAFPGGTTATYQAVIIPGQYYGASDTTANGVEPELDNAVSVFTGSTGDIVSGAECYWSPTASQWSTVQSALNAGTTTFPSNVGAPGCWVGQSRQIVYKSSVANNSRGGSYAGTPAFLFLKQIATGSVAVVEIP